jgi:hypothetical protein
MDGWNPEARDGFHADWMPSFPDGMTLTTALKVNRSPNQYTFLTKQLVRFLVSLEMTVSGLTLNTKCARIKCNIGLI